MEEIANIDRRKNGRNKEHHKTCMCNQGEGRGSTHMSGCSSLPPNTPHASKGLSSVLPRTNAAITNTGHRQLIRCPSVFDYTEEQEVAEQSRGDSEQSRITRVTSVGFLPSKLLSSHHCTPYFVLKMWGRVKSMVTQIQEARSYFLNKRSRVSLCVSEFEDDERAVPGTSRQVFSNRQLREKRACHK